MIRVTADGTPLEILEGLVELTEIVSAKGKILGHYIPSKLEASPSASNGSHPDYMELERCFAAERGKGRTTREVFESLLAVTNDPPLRAYLQEKIQQLAARE